MSAYAGLDYVGANGQSYPEVAASAVKNVAATHRSPFYGYIRSGVNQKIYLFPSLDDARGWFSQHLQLQPDHDYAAVFSATNLNAPVPGMEHFMRTATVGDDPYVGNWLPFFLGLPLGAAGGYFLRRWQEPEGTRAQVPKLRDVVRPLLPGGGNAPGRTPSVGYPWVDFVGNDPSVGAYPWVDFVGNDPSVGAYPWVDFVGNDPSVGAYPWVDFVGNDPSVGAYPWVDVVGQDGSSWLAIDPWVGAEADDATKRQASAQARALIQIAAQEVTEASTLLPSAGFWVWSLWEPSAASRPGVILEPTRLTEPVSSRDVAMDRVRELGSQPGVIARAVFDRTSRHWPNPVAWSQSPNPEHLPMIAQYVAGKAATATAGEYVGAWNTAVGAAIDDVRARARSMAQKRRGDTVGVIHTVKDNLWHALSFESPDDADDWINTATQDQDSYTYAAYFDRQGETWPNPYIEKIGGYARPAPGLRPRRAPIVGATRAEIEAYRARAKARATATTGTAVVVVITADGREHAQAFKHLDDAIDGLIRVTSLGKAAYAYAGAFDKGSTGTAYVQQEEFGEANVPIPAVTTFPRDRPATTSGNW